MQKMNKLIEIIDTSFPFYFQDKIKLIFLLNINIYIFN